MPEEPRTNGSLVPMRAVAGEVTRQEFGVQQTEKRAETAAAAVAAREQAAIQARYIMAERNPRKIEIFRLAMLDECKRPTFAAVARYGKPVGKEKNKATGQWEEKKVYGPSIRFIEAAIRNFRNLAPEVFTVFDSPTLRIVRVSVTDLESNICYANELQIEKQVERKGQSKGNKIVAPEGREVLGERTNTYGDPVFIVRATEDETLVKQNSLVSKSIRTQAQRLLPGDIVEECMETVIRVQQSADVDDPGAAMRKILDAFHELNVEPADLERWAGKPIDRLQPKDMQELRAIYTSIKEGDVTWDEIAEERAGEGGSKEDQQKVQADKLNALRKGSSTQAQATDAKAEGKSTAPAQSDAATGEPAASQMGTADPSSPEKKESEVPRHILDLRAWRETLGGEVFLTILGAAGYQTINEVPAEAFPPIQEELILAAQDRGKVAPTRDPEKPKSTKLKFGDKK